MSLSKAVNKRARALTENSAIIREMWRAHPVSKRVSNKMLIIGSAIAVGFLVKRFGIKRVYRNYALIHRLIL